MPLSPTVKQGMVSNSIKRTKSIKVYLFEQEKTTIEEKAIATGVTASEYLRSCGLRRVLTAKPPADLITIRATAGNLKSELMMLSHLAKETNNQQILDTVNNAIALIDKTIAAAFNLDIPAQSPSSLDK
ncbi:MobB protein [uncultured Nostoc sp.]|uniref:plasmid mobilization protein n=1 Tax=uncultured Nostoc sp. TaxID=340711 RepID=UPI0035CC404C